MASSIPHESIELNDDEDEIQAFVLNTLKQNWIQENNSLLIIKKLTDGLSNLIFSVRSSDDHGVIVKIYGKNSDLIVNRQAEIEFLIYLSKFHLSPAIVLTFNNGFIYEYVPGISIQNGDEEKALTIARTLARFHSIRLMDNNNQGQFIEKLRNYINLLSGINDELYKRLELSSCPYFNNLPWSEIIEDIDKIEKIFQNSKWSKLSIVVCHNDTQSLNFLYNDQQKISIIDFEHCARNIWLYDVYNYFIEYAGFEHEEPDYDQAYPSREKQTKWLETYLSNATFLNDKFEKSIPIDELCNLGDQLRAPIHLYWSLWAFLEALLNPESMKKFDYIKYGKWRLKEYEKYKNDFFSSIEKIKINTRRISSEHQQSH